MHDTTAPMHVIQTQQHLLRNLLHQPHRHTFTLMPLDQPEQVLPQDLEDHANMGPIGTFMPEMVEEGDDVRSTRMR